MNRDSVFIQRSVTIHTNVFEALRKSLSSLAYALTLHTNVFEALRKFDEYLKISFRSFGV